MTINPIVPVKNHVMEPGSSLEEKAEKAKKIAIQNIILYLKDRDNKVNLKRAYTKKEVFEFIDSISDSALPAKKLKVSEKANGNPLPVKPFFLERVSKESQGHFEIVLKAVKCNGLELQFASEKMKNDYMIVTTAVSQNGLAVQYVGEQCINSARVGLLAVRENGLALEYLPFKLRDRFDIVAAAVRQNGLALSFASQRLQNSGEIIKFADSSRKKHIISL